MAEQAPDVPALRALVKELRLAEQDYGNACKALQRMATRMDKLTEGLTDYINEHDLP